MKTIDFYKLNNEEAIKALDGIENKIITLISLGFAPKRVATEIALTCNDTSAALVQSSSLDEINEIEDFEGDIDELIEDELLDAREEYEDEMDEDDFLEGNYPDSYYVELFELKERRNRILENMFQQKSYAELRETPGLAFEI